MVLRKMDAAPVEDSSLVRDSLAGDGTAFQLLVERYQGRLFALARNYTKSPVEIEDIVQDTFLKAFARLDSFQHQSSFYTWIYRIATNTLLDHLKRRGRSPVQAVEDPEVLPNGVCDGNLMRPDARLQEKEIAEITQDVLLDLPEIFRQVLILREFEDMAYQDIADLLEISIGTVESRLFRARNKFKQKLLAKYPEFAQGAE
ncbi:MAG: sigma-70 family RNA polymerase sigma factor [Planctomycetota bacterium]|nr:sigma-70 family RNA polymerase sigma factor [Planctomycetota bacterium]